MLELEIVTLPREKGAWIVALIAPTVVAFAPGMLGYASTMYSISGQSAGIVFSKAVVLCVKFRNCEGIFSNAMKPPAEL
jgi:hypothetical protein